MVGSFKIRKVSVSKASSMSTAALAMLRRNDFTTLHNDERNRS